MGDRERLPEDGPPGFPGAQWLAGNDPERIYDRLSDGDPLDLQRRSLRRLRERGLFVDPTRAYELSLKKVAVAAPRYRGTPPLDTWLAGRIDGALDLALREDVEEERARVQLLDPTDARHALFSAAFGVPPSAARTAAVALNALPPRCRRILLSFFIQGQSIRACARASGSSPEEVRAVVREGIDELAAALERWPPRRVGGEPPSPELVGLLGEIAGDSGASLFRVEVPVTRRSFSESHFVRSSATFMTRAERHLVEVYRDEVSQLLLEACRSSAFAHPEGGPALCPFTTPERAVAVPTIEDLARSASELRATEGGYPETRAAFALLERCVTADSASLGQLAAASLRLFPSNAGRMYGRIHLTNTGDLEEALSLQQWVLSGPLERQSLAVAWEGLGRLHYLKGDYALALAAYERASIIDERRCAAALGRLVQARLTGQLDALRRAAGDFDELLPEDHRGFSWARELVARERRAARLPEHPPRLPAPVEEALGPATRALLRVWYDEPGSEG